MPTQWLQHTSASNLYCSLAGNVAHLGLVIVNNAEIDTTWIQFSSINVRTERKQNEVKHLQ